MNILVLGGGLSPEREVSLCSSTMVCNALIDNGHKAVLCDIFFGIPEFDGDYDKLFSGAHKLTPYTVGSNEPDLNLIKAQRTVGYNELIGLNVPQVAAKADIVYMGLHGSSGEDGKIQALFDSLGIRYTGSGAEGCKKAMDKWVTKAIFDECGILTPRGCIVERGEDVDIDALPIPCVVKPCSGGSSIGTTIVLDRSEIYHALELAFLQEDRALVEAYIKGREISAGVLGNEALPLIEIIPKVGFYDYKNKYMAGLTDEVTPAPVDRKVTEMIQQAALKGAKALGLEVYSRMDFILTSDGKAYCLEANTLPGMTATSLLPQEAQANGIDYKTLCQRILTISMEKYR